MPTLQPRSHLLARSQAAEVLTSDPGGTITLLADTDSTDGALATHRSTFRDGIDRAPRRFLTLATELFFVIDGSLEVLAGEGSLALRKGTTC